MLRKMRTNGKKKDENKEKLKKKIKRKEENEKRKVNNDFFFCFSLLEPVKLFKGLPKWKFS